MAIYMWIKSGLVWKLAHVSPFVFLSRPRRFGKSLLSSTIAAYFRGEKDLFEGLKIMALEEEWNSYPVLHFDLSAAKHLDIEGVKSELGLQLYQYEKIYGADSLETSPGMRLGGLIRRAKEQTNQNVVVIVDEYDAPMLDVLHDDERKKEMREVLQEFYQRLKKLEPYIRFCFITGIAKFSQLSIFSTINNLKNVSLNPAFSAICGITEEEVKEVFDEDIRVMAEKMGLTQDEMFQKIKRMYDGYHFSHDSEDIYNPFSLLNAFSDKMLDSYWFSTGTPTFLIHQFQHFKTDIISMEKLEVMSTAFDQPTDDMDDALPLLYQSGYLTIKDYDRQLDVYTLSFPNNEVRTGYVRGLIPAYLGLKLRDTQGFTIKLWRTLNTGDTEKALQFIQSYMASLPYVEGFKKKLADAATAEGFYEYTLYLIFTSLNDLVRTQVKCSSGRTDMVIFMPNAIYVMEFKVNGTAQQALQQINERGYAKPFLSDGRPVIKIGLQFDVATRTLVNWEVEQK